MLDPSRYSLDAATVGFRKRMKQTVNWESFEKAVQTQTDAIKVRRELEETPISEIHVMGGGLYGIANDEKTKTYARQQRQINGYVLRSFLSHGGPIILPPKHGEGLLMTPMNMGQRQYGGYNSIVGNYVSSFTEPLQAPLDNNTVLLARAGVAMASNSASNPFARLQFNMNMHLTQAEINKNQAQFIEQRQYNVQKDIAKELRQEESLQFSGKKRKDLMAELGDRARIEAAPQNPIAVAERRGRGANIRQQEEVAAALVAANQSESESFEPSSSGNSSIRTSASSIARKVKLQKRADLTAALKAGHPLANLFAPVASSSSSEADSLNSQYEYASSAAESYHDPAGASGYPQHGYDVSFDASYNPSSSEEEKQRDREPEGTSGTFNLGAAIDEVARIRDLRTRLAAKNTPVEKALQVTLSDGSMNAQDLQSKTESNIVNVAQRIESIEQKAASKSLFARGANAVSQLFTPSPSRIKENATPQGNMYIAPVLGSNEKYNVSRRTSVIGSKAITPLKTEEGGFIEIGKQGRPKVAKGNNSFFRTKKIEPEYQFQEGGGSVGEFSNVQGSFTATPPLKGSRSATNIHPARRIVSGTA